MKKKNFIKILLLVILIILVITTILIISKSEENVEMINDNTIQEDYNVNLSFKTDDSIGELGYEDYVVTKDSDNNEYYDISYNIDDEHDDSKLNILITDEEIDYESTDYDLVISKFQSISTNNIDGANQIILDNSKYDYLINMQISYTDEGFNIDQNMVQAYTEYNDSLYPVKELSIHSGDYELQTEIYDELSSNNINYDYIPITPYENINYIENDDVNDLVIINKNYCFADDYEPELYEYYEEAIGNNYYIDENIIDNVESFFEDIKETGYTPYIQSAYRSSEYQETLYNNYVASSSVEEADTYSARPGCSEHNTGLVIDLGVSEISGFVLDDLDNTDADIAIHSVAAQNGFIKRYLQDKQDITQYTYESWHYRYVGIEPATIIYKYNLTLEEYIQNKDYYDSLK